MFCVKCGKALDEQAKFCTYCGNRIETTNVDYHDQNKRMQDAGMWVIHELYRKEKVEFYIWIAVICYQVMIGFVLYSAWGFALWNSIACYQAYKFRQQLIRYPVGVYKHYEEALAMDVIFIVLNLVLGGVIGAVIGIYDLHIRRYAMANREALLYIENSVVQQNG